MAFTPDKRKQAAVIPLSEDLRAIGLSMEDITRSAEGVTPVLGSSVRTADELLAEGRRAPVARPAAKAPTRAEAIARARKAKMEAVRRTKGKLREGVKRTAVGSWLKRYEEAKLAAPAAIRKSGIAGLVEDIQALVAGSKKPRTVSEATEYRKAFRNVAEVAELLARKFESKGGKSVAEMLRGMKAEAVANFRRLQAESEADQSGELPDPGKIKDGDGKVKPVAKTVDPDPNDGSAGGPEMLDTDPGVDLGEPVSGEPELTGEPEQMEGAEMVSTDPGIDLGEPVSDEPEWIDPDFRKELEGYTGESFGDLHVDGDEEDEAVNPAAAAQPEIDPVTGLPVEAEDPAAADPLAGLSDIPGFEDEAGDGALGDDPLGLDPAAAPVPPEGEELPTEDAGPCQACGQEPCACPPATEADDHDDDDDEPCEGKGCGEKAESKTVKNMVSALTAALEDYARLEAKSKAKVEGKGAPRKTVVRK